MGWLVRGLNTGMGKGFFVSSELPDRLWGPREWYRGYFLVESDLMVKLATHLLTPSISTGGDITCT
jgi:hypothetical protein